ncbi:MAG: GNAT family N-acetyltransferase [Fimbriimonadaceae bacterium]|nr:GNAT family N-acetyltransferase [Fimbriimonadaceae bacterium]
MSAVELLRWPLDHAVDQRWDHFVARHEQAAFTYLSGHLTALATTTCYRVRGAWVRQGEQIRGVLPWVEHPWSGARVSLPFYEYGGPLLADPADDGAVAQLLAAAGPLTMRIAGGWRYGGAVARHPLHEFAVLPLQRDPERVLAGCDRMLRKALRKSAREGVVVVRNNSAAALERDFLPAWLRWLRDRHGTPPLAPAYWRAVHRALPGVWQLWQARQGDRLLAQLLGFVVGPRVVITTIVSNEEAWGARPNDALHWAFLQWACRRGLRWFDFGSARYAGQRRYKAKWGCRLVPYEQVSSPPRAVAALTPEGPATALARRLWRRLPLPWTTRLGPPLREWLTL